MAFLDILLKEVAGTLLTLWNSSVNLDHYFEVNYMIIFSAIRGEAWANKQF